MKNIVFLVGSYYPKYSAVGKCLGNLADALDREYKVTVISTATDVMDSHVCEYRNQTIYKVFTCISRKRLMCEKELAKSRGLTSNYYFIKLQFLRFENALRVIIAHYSINNELVKAYVKTLKEINEPIDLIIPTCNPFESVKAAMLYKECNNHTKIIPILFDLFAPSVAINRLKCIQKLKFAENILLEKAMFASSEFILHVSNWSEYIKEKHPEYLYKCKEIEHPLLVKLRVIENNMYDDTKINMVYTGVVDLKFRNPQWVVKFLEKLNHKDMIVHFYSLGTAQRLIDNASKRMPELFYSHGSVDSNTALAAQEHASMLISIGNANASQIPSKIFEYVSQGKPIIHFASTTNDPTITALKKYQLSMVVLKDNCKNACEINKVNQFITENMNKRVKYDDVSKIYSEATPEYLSKILRRYI